MGKAGGVVLDGSSSVKPLPPLCLLAQTAHRCLFSPRGWAREQGLITAKSTRHHCHRPPVEQLCPPGDLLAGTSGFSPEAPYCTRSHSVGLARPRCLFHTQESNLFSGPAGDLCVHCCSGHQPELPTQLPAGAREVKKAEGSGSIRA